MEIKRLADEWDVFATVSYFEKIWPDLDLFGWVDCNRKERYNWILNNARMWDVYDGNRFLGYVAATSHYKGRWVFHFGSIKEIDHKSAIRSALRLFLKEAHRERVRMVAVYINDDRPDIRRLARIFKFRHYFGNLWALNQKHQNLNPSNKLHLQCAQKTRM
jgi:hypothetical protein